MPRTSSVPAYRLHKPSGQAVVTIPLPGGRRRDVYLGRYDTPESRAEYARVLAGIAGSSGSYPAGVHVPDITINELILAYVRQVTPNEPRRVGGSNPRFTLRALRELFGSTIAAEFGPRSLKALRDAWVSAGHSRKVINARVGAVRRVFRWAVAEELVGPEVYQRLQAVEGLRTGRTAAPDRPPVKPAVMADVETALPHMPPAVRALVLVQIHSAARAGELVKLRVCDIDRADPEVWAYTPAAHKGTWKGKARVIFFGTRCQEVLAPLLLKADDPDAYVFSPARAEAERNAGRSENRVTPKWDSHMARNERKRVGVKRRRPPGEHYTTGTYRQAIERACARAEVPVFTPHRLRHLAATRTRAELGVDVARALCGHTLATVTEVYSREVDKQLALQAVKRFG